MQQQGSDHFARVDFQAPAIPPRGLVFDGFDCVIQTTRHDDVVACLREVERLVNDGCHAVGFVCYEAAAAFDVALCTHAPSHLPLLWFGVSRRPRAGDAVDVAGTGEFGPWSAAWSQEEYETAFAAVQRHIRDGDTYQLNLTFPLHSAFHGRPAVAYDRIRAAQAARYAAMLQTPEWAILSISPELFFTRAGRHIVTRPMKGTRARGMTTANDAAIAAELERAPKDRAENVMIVDLLRNDLGRIARMGTVRPTALFRAERYPTVWQMTSTVEAELDDGVALPEIFQALFPCGSVTGAPKVKTMELIRRYETQARGVYCGTVGYLAPGGDAVFNVAIRTVTIARDRAEYPVGSGVVADSDGGEEYAECSMKAAVLERAPAHAFELLETMLWEPAAGYRLLDRHLARLADSAAYFDFAVDLDGVRQRLAAAARAWDGCRRVRLLLAADGGVTVESQAHDPAAQPFRYAVLAAAAVDRNDPFLYHKTTRRRVYEEAAAQRPEATEVLLYNDAGELTEGTISNVAVRLDGVWCTPPVNSGLLAGTERAERLARGELQEHVVHVDDLARADGMRLLNSVRGAMDVVYRVASAAAP